MVKHKFSNNEYCLSLTEEWGPVICNPDLNEAKRLFMEGLRASLIIKNLFEIRQLLKDCNMDAQAVLNSEVAKSRINQGMLYLKEVQSVLDQIE